MWNPREFKNVLSRYFDMVTHTDELYLYLYLTWIAYNNTDYPPINDNRKLGRFKIPSLYEVEIEHYGHEHEETQEDECIDGYAQHTGDECECDKYEESLITITDSDGDSYEDIG